MAPQWSAYQVSPHSHVDCVECHVGSGMKSYVQAKVNGTKQMIEVTFHTWPTPIRAPSTACVRRAKPARSATRPPVSSAKSCSSKPLSATTRRTP